jgi:hypothetical protein
MDQKDLSNLQKKRQRNSSATYYLPPDNQPFPNYVMPYSPSVFESISSGHGVISQGVGHTNAGRGLAKIGGGTRRRQQRGGNPTIDPFSNVSYMEPSAGISGFHPSFFDGVYSGHGTSSYSMAHSTAGLGLGKYDQIGFGHSSLWEYLNLDPESEKVIEQDGQRVAFDNLYWFPGPLFAMFEVEYQDGQKSWKGDGIILDRFGKKIIRGRLISCHGEEIETRSLWSVLSNFFEEV